jgi:hypothetical protein
MDNQPYYLVSPSVWAKSITKKVKTFDTKDQTIAYILDKLKDQAQRGDRYFIVDSQEAVK